MVINQADNKPDRIEVLPLFIPAELKTYSQWVCWKWEWKKDKWTKPPYDAKTNSFASSTGSSTWVSFEEAFAAYDRNHEFAGIGFVPTADDPYALIDLDHCVDETTGHLEPWAQEIVDLFNSYTEITPSGTGIRIIIKGKLPGTGRKKDNKEVYDKGHYLTLTGHVLPGASEGIVSAQNKIDAFIKKYFPDKNESKEIPLLLVQNNISTLSDMEIMDRAGKAKNGDKFRQLMNGDIIGYPSQSEADLALCSMLAFWCCKDAVQMDRIFRGSKLYRSKWDEKHGQNNYGNNTILKAIQDCKETYSNSENVCLNSTGEEQIIIYLPSAKTTISKSAEEIFKMMAAKEMAFYRGGKIQEVVKDSEDKLKLEIISPDAFRSRIEKLGSTYSYIMTQRGEYSSHPKRPSNEDSKAIMATTEARDYLPSISNIYSAPVLIPENNELVLLKKGYNRANGGAFVCSGDKVPEIPFDEAVRSIEELLSDFQYLSESDRTRHLSLILSPALRFGGFFNGYCPIHCFEADQSQAGKGYALNIVLAIYGEECSMVTMRNGGVGSFDESLSKKLVDGRPFIQFDNLRGKLDSQHLEAVLTSNKIGCRIPHHGEIDVDPQKYFYMSTSNGFESTEDLANRSCIIRIRKQAHGYRFKLWPEGDLKDHVISNQQYYLGCVHSIIRSWWNAGALRSHATDHDFRDWARTIEGIIKFAWPDTAPLFEGHRVAQARTANPSLSWLRSVCLALESSGRLDEELSASSIVEFCFEKDIEIPGLRQSADEDTAKRQVGIVFGKIMKENSFTLDEFVITRREVAQKRNDGQGYFQMKMYTVDKATVTTTTTVGNTLGNENIMSLYGYRAPTVVYCGTEERSKLLPFERTAEQEEILMRCGF